jgi:hypothetical protein
MDLGDTMRGEIKTVTKGPLLLALFSPRILDGQIHRGQNSGGQGWGDWGNGRAG